ncbi:WD-REPEATS-REGION domain-containing protein [Mycena indigotica]|uniref:WD-REPEATS-REGION domain-containing protein n=1 Tax=Mycena indigotica TaxID=2126181 RepID=A0A8H6TEY3_9AGAR|nr:WD-REPEATS-REGION domain-containing protein [Mycena indigotica]KAF7316478.1 WD-REPEATS-REGION domain-containing protein [Mycena indigotica]
MSFKQYALFPPTPTTARGVATRLSAHKEKIVYTNGKSVIIRDLNNPLLAKAYVGHVQNTSVARISPTGYYCASADVFGTVRVWDTVGEDNVLKGEFKVISGKINDLEWDGESKRIIAVGDGREKFGHAFMFDTGSSTGEISGHTKAINAVAIRHQRPFRAATAGDDGLIIFHQGTPYKYDKTIRTHTKFVQDVRYAPSGDHFTSVGSDSRIFLYDGKTGETIAEFTDSPHTGSVMACSWSPDSKSFITSSADCTVKLWDVEARKATASWSLGSGVNNQQVGNVWTREADLVSLSLSGDLNVFDARAGNKPARIITGPQKSITAIAPSTSTTFLAGTADGRVVEFTSSTGEATAVQGDGHTNIVVGLAATPTGKVLSAGYDDRVREISGGSFAKGSVGTGSQPKTLAAGSDGTAFVVEAGGVEAIRDNQKVAQLSTSFNASAVGASTNNVIAVGGEDQKVRLYEWSGTKFTEIGLLENNKGVVSALAFSPDGSLLAAGDSSGRIVLFDVKEKKMVTARWSFHSARVNSLAWTLDGKHCASGSLDTHVYVWSVDNPSRNIALKNAGPGGINGVMWVAEGKLAGAGADGCNKIKGNSSSEKVELTEQEAEEYPHGLKLALLLLTLCIAVFLVALDNTILATALPNISDYFNSLDDVPWYISAYLLTSSSFQLLFGKLYSFLPIKWVFISAVTIFEVGSAICGAAPTSTALIVGRAIAGLGSAGIFSGALIIISHSIPLEKRATYLGLVQGMFGIASVAGPLLGGAFTDKVTWRWCFYINLPVGSITLLFMTFFFKMPPAKQQTLSDTTLWARIKQLDPLGTITFVPAIVCLLLAMQWGGTKYEWSNGRIIALFVLFGVLLVAFAVIQWKVQDSGTIPPRVFKQRSVWAGSIFAFSLGGGFILLVYYVPIWLQAIKGVSAVHSGIDTIPMIGSLVFGILSSAMVISAVGFYVPFLYLSTILMSIGAGLLSTFTTTTNTGQWVGYQIIYGVGVGFGAQIPVLAAQTALPEADMAVGTTIPMFMQSIGGALFVSVGANIFAGQLASGLVAHVPGIEPSIVLNAGATSLAHTIDPQYLPIVVEVYNSALMKAFKVGIAMSALSIVGALSMEWRSVKLKGRNNVDRV